MWISIGEIIMDIIHVVSATYGTLTNGADVTLAVQNILNSGATSFVASNEVLGGDPDVGEVKVFGISCLLPNGTPVVRGAQENDTVVLPS